MKKTAVKVLTELYKFAHGKKPKGFGMWAFSPDIAGVNIFYAPNAMEYKDAIKWAKDEVLKKGNDYFHVMP